MSYLIMMCIQSEWEIYTPITEEIGALCVNELIIQLIIYSFLKPKKKNNNNKNK